MENTNENSKIRIELTFDEYQLLIRGLTSYGIHYPITSAGILNAIKNNTQQQIKASSGVNYFQQFNDNYNPCSDEHYRVRKFKSQQNKK